MTRNHTRASSGFTLIELLVVVAIIGIIATILVPNLLDALQKAKQKRTMADIKLIGTSWFSWLTDQYSAAAAGQSQLTLDWSDFVPKSYDDLVTELVPRYSASIPRQDGWKKDFEFGVAEDLEAAIPLGIRSAGSDTTFEPGPYQVGAFVATDYEQDIVWAGGFFIRWPSGLP